MAKDIFTALGLMSGTSMDGIDAALLRTDGERIIEPLAAMSFPYNRMMRCLLAQAMKEARGMTDRTARPGVIREAEEAVTEAHIAAVRAFREKHDVEIGLIGFHGQTLLHRPEKRLTVQIGDGARLADASGVTTVWDMRANDVARGGQGAPLIPVYHRALASGLERAPVAFVNIGGVANVTWIGGAGKLLAFDCGPGNALLDDWMMKHAGKPLDENGALAAAGRADEAVLRDYLASPFLAARPPKSLDRGDFPAALAEHLSPADGAATLTELTARAISRASRWFPEPVKLWIITGGGRLNRHMMARIAANVAAPVAPAEAFGMDGDMMEAQGWAYLAARCLKGLPITFPGTTGAPQPLSGGVVSRAQNP